MKMNKQELMTNVNEILDKHLGNTIFTDPVLSITKSAKDNRVLMELEFEQGGIVLEKELLKLKDVIVRIKQLDIGTRKVWLDEILNELGSDYGTLKYKAGYEQGKLEGEWVGQQLKDADEIRQELNKPTVPQFVAEYIEFKKKYDFHVYGAMREIEDHYDKRVPEWFYENNIETFVRAWIDGYTIEKEPKYTVKFKATKQYLSSDELGPHFDPSFRSNFTKSDLEKLGLAEVFNSPLFEVEEV